MQIEEIFENFNKTSRLLWNIEYVQCRPSENHYREYNFFGSDGVNFIPVPMLDKLEESDLHAMDGAGCIRGTLYIDKEKQKYGLMTDI